MSAYFCIPSKRPMEEMNACLSAWREMGYKTAVMRETGDGYPGDTFVLPTHSYIGWARSTNLLIGAVMANDPDAEWFVGGGDDYFPDPTKTADEIAHECAVHFLSNGGDYAYCHASGRDKSLFGVMQPTGDRWSEGRCTTCSGTGSIYTAVTVLCPDCQGKGRSAVIDRIAGSPWMGREFCRRMYHGSGPMYNGYYHNFADEELQNVARKLGVFWQRRDLVQWHRHWAAARPKSATHTGLSGDVRNMPAWAEKINDPKQSDWDKSKALFAKRKAAGFPGHEPLEV